MVYLNIEYAYWHMVFTHRVKPVQTESRAKFINFTGIPVLSQTHKKHNIAWNPMYVLGRIPIGIMRNTHTGT